MKRARFTEEQIIGVLKEHEAGAKTADLARKHSVSETPLYNWKVKFGGMDASGAKRLKQLVDEKAKLKKLLAEKDALQRRNAGRYPFAFDEQHLRACHGDGPVLERPRLCCHA